jgi:hypothetical protein
METDRKKSENWEEEASTYLNQGYSITTDENNELWWVLNDNEVRQ